MPAANEFGEAAEHRTVERAPIAARTEARRWRPVERLPGSQDGAVAGCGSDHVVSFDGLSRVGSSSDSKSVLA